jgi:DNA alkylation repair enzyme
LAELLKDVYSREFFVSFGRKVQSTYSAFNTPDFVDSVMDATWDALPLKARTRRISTMLGYMLPVRYEAALDVLFAIADTCVGFPYLFFPDFVAVYGQAEEHWKLSMKALEYFTQKSSSEFAIRPFILSDPDRVMRRIILWAKHPDENVRRFASEGCRPRLPWGEALPMFKEDPTAVLAVLELLKADSSLYVRKSVANNLNDISKDNPDVVLKVARRWKGESSETDWIIRQGCRALIRKANHEAMELFGYASTKEEAPLTTSALLSLQPSEVAIGGNCKIQYALDIRKGEPVHVRIEYAIDFVKANGKTSRKSFFLSDKTVSGGVHLTGTRMHSWLDMTTRRHYPGDHRIVLLVNGKETAESMLTLRSNN